METIQNRIEMIIKAKSGSKKAFAEKMGWQPSYLSNILNEEKTFGLQPLMHILSVYKDISARWLLFGEGYMFGNVRDGLLQKMAFLGFLERYLPAMSNEEVQMYTDAVRIPQYTEYALSHIEQWRKILELREIIVADNYVEMLQNIGFDVK